MTVRPDDARARRLTSDEFRHVIGHFATGVTVITAVEGKPVGATASAVSSLSLDPPMVLICMNKTSFTGDVIARVGAFAINILSEGQGFLAAQFASSSADKFDGVATVEGACGQPLIEEALAHLECRVTERVTGGTHAVFLAEVQSATARPGAPLAYFRGKFGRLELTQDETAYEAMRSWVKDRPGGDMLDLAEISRELELRPGALSSALDRLTSEGQLRRRPGGGYVVTPSEITNLHDFHEAHAIIEIGVAIRTVGRTSPVGLQRLRRAMELSRTPLNADGQPLNLRQHIAANSAFHATMVGLAENRAIDTLYRRADPSEMLLLVGMRNPAAIPFRELLADHGDLVEAYESGIVARAIEVIARHSERAKRATTDSLEAPPAPAGDAVGSPALNVE